MRDGAEHLVNLARSEQLRCRIDGQDAEFRPRLFARDVCLNGGCGNDVVRHFAAELHLFAHELRERERRRAVGRVDVRFDRLLGAAVIAAVIIVARFVAVIASFATSREKHGADCKDQRGERYCQKLFHIFLLL